MRWAPAHITLYPMADAVARFVLDAAEMWETKGRVYMDPEQACEETTGECPTDLAARFAEYGVPFRDYAKYGPAWVRETEASR